MSNRKKVWVLAESEAALAQLMAGGKQLGEEAAAIIYGGRKEAEKAVQLGADKVYWLGEIHEDRIMEDYTETIAALVQKEWPRLLLVESGKRGKLIAGRLAAIMGSSVLANTGELIVDGGTVQARHMVYGGAACRTVKGLTDTIIAVVNTGVFNALPEDTGRQGEIMPVQYIEPAVKIKVIDRKKKEGLDVNLTDAKRVVGIGRGIERQEDIRMIEELAGAMGAEIGCTRPIAEGVNWLPRERYIGVSGVMLNPDLYLALGISGQVQHMVGVDQAKVIVAVNKDKAAPIFKKSDYGIVGDIYKILPLLIEKFKAL